MASAPAGNTCGQRAGWWARLPAEPAVNLGMARVIVCASVLLLIEQHGTNIVNLAAMPPETHLPPRVLKYLLAWVPTSPELVGALLGLLRGLLVLCLLGAASRTTALLACVLSVYVLGQRYLLGGVGHALHYAPLMLAVLAATPCGDALGFDARLRSGRWRGPAEPAPAYGAGVLWIGVVLGLAYVFPGVWKLASAGWDWFNGQALLRALQMRLDPTPLALPIDRWPWVLALGGTFTLLLELLFLPLVFVRAARPWLAAACVVFHALILLFLQIDFMAMSLTSLALVDWSRVLRVPAWTRRPERTRGPARAAGVVGAVIAASFVWTGVTRQGEAWPVSVFPTFVWLAGDHPFIEARCTWVDRAGVEHPLADGDLPELMGEASQVGKVLTTMLWRPVGQPRADAHRAALLHALAERQGVLGEAVALRVYREQRPVGPRRGPGATRELVQEVPIRRSPDGRVELFPGACEPGGGPAGPSGSKPSRPPGGVSGGPAKRGATANPTPLGPAEGREHAPPERTECGVAARRTPATCRLRVLVHGRGDGRRGGRRDRVGRDGG